MNTKEVKEKVLLQANILDVVRERINVKKNGADWFALCPFHDEKGASFSVSENKQFYKCFGCGAQGDVIDFVMNYEKVSFGDAVRLLAAKYNVEYGVESFVFKSAAKRPLKIVKAAPKTINFVPKEVLLQSLNAYEHNPLYSYFVDAFGESKTNELFVGQYYVGTSKNGSTIYWQVDQYNRIRTAQKIKYKPDGHRDKLIPPVRVFTGDKGYAPCFFGEHLLATHGPEYMIGMVESEKTAMICTALLPELDGHKMVYIASSGSNGITDEKLAALKGRDVCLIPDFSYTSRAVWGKLPMRKKLVDGKVRIAPDGDIDDDYVSVRHRLTAAGAKVCFWDPVPEIDDGSDIADHLIHPACSQINEPNLDELTLKL